MRCATKKKKMCWLGLSLTFFGVWSPLRVVGVGVGICVSSSFSFVGLAVG